ncbi:MAG: hypothetical protein CMJ94_08925 [Planctomycetes bacterium]|nr:hypothetical protein [Planctomycetota bacterium]
MNQSGEARSSPSERPRWAWPLLFAAVLAVSTGALFVRLADPAPAMAKAAWRCTIAALVLLAVGHQATARAWAEASPRTRRQLILAGFVLAVHFGTWILSLSYTTVTSTMVLGSTAPAWTALLAPRLIGERTTRAQWQGILLCGVGIALLAFWPDASPGGDSAGPTASQPLLGNLLALAGAISFSLFLIVGRTAQRSVPALPYLGIAYAGAAVFLILGCLLLGLPLTGFDARTYGWLLALALVPQLIGHSGYNLALRFFSAATVSILLIGEPIFGTVLAWLFLAEPPTTGELLGGVFLLLGIVRTARGAAR